jgi:parallel beta-helix repeat protein
MKRTLWLLTLVGMVLMSAGPVLAQDGFYVIAGGGKAGTQINTVPFTINSPGLYCLAKNLTYSATTGNAITVDASDVTIDLMGFCLTGPGKVSGMNYGIRINDGCANVEIRNGILKSFGYQGISTASTACLGARVIGLRVRDTGGAGITLNGSNNLVMGCTVMLAGNNGISVGAESLVKGNQVYSNGSFGISAATGSTVMGNLAYLNSSGLHTSSGCSVTDNSVYSNSNYGMDIASYSTVTRNTAHSNPSMGIAAGSYCTITNNTTQGLTNGSNCILANNTVY